jgi:carboxylesterase
MLAGSKPFLWAERSREAVLCIHGFTGAPGIFRKLGRVLVEENLSVYAPRLPGHATTPEDLAGVTSGQLISAAEEAYLHLKSTYERIHIIGLSLGGALATLIAAAHAGESSLGCVSLLSPGYSFNKTLMARLGLSEGRVPSGDGGRMIPLPQRKPQNDEMDECIFGYGAVPLVVFTLLQSLNAEARVARANVMAPLLLLYTEADSVVDAEACAESARIFPRLEEVKGFKVSEHNLLLGCDREETMSRCASFIQRHRL